MPDLTKRPDAQTEGETSFGVQATLISFGLAAPIVTYSIAVSSLLQDTKVTLLVGLSVIYLAICVWTIFQLRRAKSIESNNFAIRDGDHSRSDLEDKLAALEDAREFFGTSLKPGDMFRLVGNRMNEIVPFETCLLLVKDGNTDMLRVVHTYGANAVSFDALDISSDESLAGLSFLSNEIEVAATLETERGIFPFGILSGLGSSATIPLIHENDTFAVAQLFFAQGKPPDAEAVEKLTSIGHRISPIFLGSMAFERSLSNALTDPLTQLPNERAFHMVLENQLAESQRFRDERPLTVLAIDIKNFDEMNRDHGHALGDRALSFAAEKISTQLRKMDFLARSMNDEFLIVLPKASERTALEITGRIQLALSNSPLSVSDEESVKVWLNFGWATFWKDGETSQQLIQSAYTRKQQAKSEDPGNVVFFPKEYVN